MSYIKKLLNDYTVIDLETTGLSPVKNDIIEVGLVKVRNNIIIDTYQVFINPGYLIPTFITNLTGITNEMLEEAHDFHYYEQEILDFIGKDVLLGHNTSFDYKFLNASLSKQINNHYMDTLQFSRKVYPELSRHRLTDMVEYLNLSPNAHRALADAIATKELYDAIKERMYENNQTIQDLWRS